MSAIAGPRIWQAMPDRWIVPGRRIGAGGTRVLKGIARGQPQNVAQSPSGLHMQPTIVVEPVAHSRPFEFVDQPVLGDEMGIGRWWCHEWG
jgi:hypothetical protein